jgi:NADPH:quinone reductase-like Zn-dependent oxidoreductase
MKAVRIHAYEGVPAIEEVDAPTAGAGEVLVKVASASLNPLDVKLQKGFVHAFFPLAFPYTVGTDLAGTIEAMGADVTGWAIGDRVVVRTDPTAGGACATSAVVLASYLVKVPDSVSFETAAGIPTAAGTAWQALHEVAHLKAGQSVLIHAGTGGVGSFAIQYARAARARVIATASGGGIDIAKRRGADQVIDYRAENFAAKLSDLDAVLDTIGGETQQRSFGVLRSGGVLASTVQPPDDSLAKAHRVTASFVFHSSDATRLARVVETVAQGTRALIDRSVPLTEFDAAFAHQASGRARGKIIVNL